MPKMKTNRGAAKRFRLTATGKVKRFRAGKRHFLTKKNSMRKMRLRQATTIDKCNAKQIKSLLAG